MYFEVHCFVNVLYSVDIIGNHFMRRLILRDKLYSLGAICLQRMHEYVNEQRNSKNSPLDKHKAASFLKTSLLLYGA
jgi:predicted methyltransferase MtxX (methanogen marker protein 4)